MAELRHDDRTAVITAGGRGFGRAHALMLASRGCEIEDMPAPDGQLDHLMHGFKMAREGNG